MTLRFVSPDALNTRNMSIGSAAASCEAIIAYQLDWPDPIYTTAQSIQAPNPKLKNIYTEIRDFFLQFIEWQTAGKRIKFVFNGSPECPKLT